MSAIRKFEISIEDIVSVGATCRPENIKVSFEKPFCADIACEYNENTRTIEIEVGPECENTCLYVVIECTEQCIDCYERIKVCACSGEADCDGCSDCIDGICVSDCTNGEFCDGNECVECNSDIPCPDGKICQNGKCVCPDGQFEDETGKCVPCLTGTCPPCHVCTPEGCKPIDCGDKVCDPILDECVECVGSGDCGPNEKCVGNECVCKDGYVRNANGDCVKDRECNSDTDCPDCFECDEFGECKPIICPAGEVCIDGDCVVPCEHGGDCPPGFGCDGEKCVECNTLDCTTTECADVLGCGCNKDNKCVDTTKCDGDCSSYADCGEGCTCYNGKCISCEDLPCDMCDVPGCVCVGNKCISTDVGCTDDVKITSDDISCDLIGTATIRDNCNCTPLNVTITPTGFRQGEVDLKAILRKGSATSYTDATLKNALDNTSAINIAENELPTSGVIELVIELVVFRIDDEGRRTGNNQTITYFTDTFSFINTAQSSINGVKLARVGDEGQFVSGDTSTYKVYSQRIKIEYIADIEIPGSNCTYLENNDVIKNEIINAVTYDNLMSASSVNDPAFDILKDYHNFTSDDLRNPFFTWYRLPSTGTNFDLNNPSQAFRKMYVSGSGGQYVDTLVDWEDGLFNGYKYALHVDCPCDNNLDVYGQVKICNPENITGTFQECGSKFTPNNFSPCDINRYIDATQVPSDAIVKYKITFDGNSPSNITDNVFVYDNLNNLINSNGESFFQQFENGNDTIGEVTITIFTTGTDICEITIPGPDVDIDKVNASFDCDSSEVRISKTGENGTSITNIEVDSGTINDEGSYWRITKGGIPHTLFNVTATFSTGCIINQEININPCDCLDATVQIESSTPVIGEDHDITVNVSGGIDPFNIYIRKNNLVVVQETTSSPSTVLTVPSIEEGQYTITVQSPKGTHGDQCQIEKNFSFAAVSTDLTFNIDPTCLGANVRLNVNTGTSSLSGYKLHIEREGNPIIYTLDSRTNQVFNLGPSSENGANSNGVVIKINELRDPSGNIIKTFTDTFTLEIVEKPSVTNTSFVDSDGVAIVGDICQNTETYFRVTGTIGSIVTVSPSGSGTIGSDGYLDIPIDTTSAGSVTYAVTSIELNGCTGTNLGNSNTLTIGSSNVSIQSDVTPCYDNSINTLVEFFVNEQPGSSVQLIVKDDSNNTLNFSNFQEVTDPLSNYNGWYVATKEFDQGEQLSITSVSATYTTNTNCVVSTQAPVPECAQGLAPILTVSKRSSCNGDPVEIDVDDLQLDTPSGVVDVVGGQYNVEIIYNGSSVDTAVEGGTLTFTPDSAGNGISFDYRINITGGSFAGQTLLASDTINSPSLTFNVTSTPVQSQYGEEVTFFTVGAEFNSYEWTIGANPPVTTTTNQYTWTAPSADTETTVTVVGTGYKGGASTNICEMTATTTHYTIFDCPTTNLLTASSDEITVTNETCAGGDGEIVVDEAGLTLLGLTAPYDYSSGDLTGSTTSSLSANTYTGIIQDASGCTISYNIIVEQLPEEELSFNGSFEDCTPGTENIATCGAVTDSSGTVDVWLPPVDISRSFGPAGMTASPDGGKFVGAHASSNEGFTTNISIVTGKTYNITFYQGYGGSQGTPVGSEAAWTINVDGQTFTSDIMTFEGFGSQTWGLQTIQFTATSTNAAAPLVFSVENTPGGNPTNALRYLVIDGISVKENCI